MQADFSAKSAACVRKPAGEASFSYSAAFSAEMLSVVTKPCVLAIWFKAVGIFKRRSPYSRSRRARLSAGKTEAMIAVESLACTSTHATYWATSRVWASQITTASPVLGAMMLNYDGKRDNGARGVSVKGEGIILSLGLDHKKTTRRELGAQLGGRNLKDRYLPGGVLLHLYQLDPPGGCLSS